MRAPSGYAWVFHTRLYEQRRLCRQSSSQEVLMLRPIFGETASPCRAQSLPSKARACLRFVPSQAWDAMRYPFRTRSLLAIADSANRKFTTFRVVLKVRERRRCCSILVLRRILGSPSTNAAKKLITCVRQHLWRGDDYIRMRLHACSQPPQQAPSAPQTPLTYIFISPHDTQRTAPHRTSTARCMRSKQHHDTQHTSSEAAADCRLRNPLVRLSPTSSW